MIHDHNIRISSATKSDRENCAGCEDCEGVRHSAPIEPETTMASFPAQKKRGNLISSLPR